VNLAYRIAVSAVILLVAALALALLIGVWTPDVIFARKHTIGRAEAASGDTFEVIQYWNRGDFYNTELTHCDPTGASTRQVLDGDDSKSWSVSISLDEQKAEVTIILNGNRPKTIRYGPPEEANPTEEKDGAAARSEKL
jgi:hypothetical protein